MGEIIASKIVAPHVLQRYNFAAGYSIVELKLGKKYEGKTLAESQIRQDYSLNIVALQKRVPYITEEGKSAYKIDINDSFIESLEQNNNERHESNIIEKREFYTYGTTMSADENEIDNNIIFCKECLDRTRKIVFS